MAIGGRLRLGEVLGTGSVTCFLFCFRRMLEEVIGSSPRAGRRMALVRSRFCSLLTSRGVGVRSLGGWGALAEMV